MALLNRKRLLLAKIESSYGTDSVPTAGSNAILVRNLEVTPQEVTYASRDLVRSFMGGSDQLPGSAQVRVNFEVEMASSGAAGTAPAYGPLLRACGFSETVNVSTSVVYDPVSAGFESCSIYFNIDGVQHRIIGARGNVTVSMEADAIPVFQFEMLGLYNAPTDVAFTNGTYTAFQTPVPVNRVNTTTFTLHSISAVVRSFTANMGIETVRPEFVNGTDEVYIQNRNATGNVSFQAVTVATKDWFATAKAGTTGALSVIHGSGAGSIMELAAPAVQITNPTYADQDGIAMLGSELMFLPTTGNNEFVITAR